jgi:AraC-like DNA-binding protein
MRDEAAVRAWRPEDLDHLVLLHGRVASYAADARTEVTIGLIGGSGLVATRGRGRHVLLPGDLGVWLPGQAHRGRPLAGDGRPWECRLLVLELPDLHRFGSDPERRLRTVEFTDPVVRQPRLAGRFLELHRLLDRPASTLEREVALREFLEALLRDRGVAAPGPVLDGDDDRALRRAGEYLHDQLARNVSLEELAAAAGSSPFRLIRLFRRRFGVAPHAFQVDLRVRTARRLLERGERPAQVAAEVGFHDQSHLSRHFTRIVGMTPGDYRRATAAAGARRNVQDSPARAG